MDERNWPNLCEMFFAQADEKKAAPFLWRKEQGHYQPTSWAEAAGQITRLAEALDALGVKKGDRVVLISENRPEWFVADLAIMALGAYTVPAYTTNTQRDHLHILENSGARVAILSTRTLAKNFLPAAHQSDALMQIIAMEDPQISQKLNVSIELWDDALGAQPGDQVALREKTAGLARNDICCLIYTSGTGGSPKGVMLTHGAILHNCEGAKEVVDELKAKNHRFLSFLPLSHAYEHSGGQFLPLYVGAEIYYAQSMDKLAANFIEARPTIMTVVPRLFEMLQTRILKAVKKEGGVKEKLFYRALALGQKQLNGKLSASEAVQNRILDILVRKKVRGRFGGQIEALISGGSALNPDVGIFFSALGLPLLQGYGQTESAPVIAVNRPSTVKMHTVGPPLRNTAVKIADDGEILVQGELVMQGYWQNQDASDAVLVDGWLHTGDIGELDDDGHLLITDRKKDIIVNDKGDNVSPQRIEGILTLEPEIAQAMIYGEGKPHLVCLLVPDPDWLKDWAGEMGKEANTLDGLRDDDELKKAMDAAMGRVNSELSNLERIRRFTLAGEAFTIDNEQMTPTMKIRRHVIGMKYIAELEGLY
jgi:long-chain acyl-CoA synthetase